LKSWVIVQFTNAVAVEYCRGRCTVTNASSVEYETVVVGAAYLVKGILQRLEVVQAIDSALEFQPEVATTYGTLAQVVVANRMTFDPRPLYHLAAWAQQRGMDHVFGIQSAWLDDDRLGAMLEGLADHQVTIWSTVMKKAVERFQVDREWLRGDTTSVYFEGVYEEANGAPKAEQERVPLLVKGYNKDGQRKKVQFVLSLVTSGRVPIWYRPWDGNQTDDGVYVADMSALRKAVLAPDNAVLIGDRKLCNEATLLEFCRLGQQFLGAHAWTDRAKAVWEQTWSALQKGERSWTEVAYASRNDAHKPLAQRPQYRVCEVGHALRDKERDCVYLLRWVFSWSSRKAEQDAQERSEALTSGERELERIAGLLGRYDYICRKTIEARIEKALLKARASRYLSWTLEGTDADQAWVLRWVRREEVIAQADHFDGIALFCTNVPPQRLSAGEVMVKYKGDVGVEQTIDFIKSPVQIRPMWLHSPKRLAGLTLLIMIAVLVAALLEYQVRRWIARTGRLVEGLMPERRDNPFPTAKTILRAFGDYALVLVRREGDIQEIHHPKLRPVQQQIWDIMELAPMAG
jgi:transposase